ncbi:flagellin [Sporolactobacillus terrae]|uniref:flagellin N-terminal helical domain-containing protein n=1 Tax=Sporolactobacillus terrae TaxID=269673 RepID=UPI000491A89D|nr:flagellin [Sporolactobacillus terrae]UAK16761.1 flagellin [Sporolactobacillus terrae]
MIINHNIAALNTLNNLSKNTAATQKSLEKLSSGLRINRAGDDAAGLAISEKMRGQIRGLDMASKNAQDGTSLIQTAEGALNETHSILQRMRELAVQSSNDTNTASDREEIQKEISQLTSEVDRIADTTEFNTKKLLTGSIGVQTSNGENITKLNVGAATKSGTLNFTTADATMATQASATINIATGTTAAADGTLNITANGQTYNVGFSAGQTFDDIAKNISSTVDGYTATFDQTTSDLAITSDDANADQSISVAEAVANTLDGSDHTTAEAGTGTNASGLTAAGASFAYQGNNVTVTSGDFTGLQFTLASEGATAAVNGSSITVSGGLTFQIGANEDQNLNLSINAMDSQNLGISQVDVTTQAGANSAISKIDNAIGSVSSERAKLGAYQNRLEHTINNLGTSSENLTAAESRIRDVDMAKEMSNFTKNNILNQAAQAMLAQSNQLPQGVLQLLR